MIGSRVRVVTALATLLLGLPPLSAVAALTPEAFEECLLQAINTDRTANGVGTLQMGYDLNADVRAFSQKVAGEGDLRHMTSTERDAILPFGTYTWGENVAWHSSPNLSGCATIHEMFMNSSAHRANVLSADKRFVALGVYIGSNGTWATELFFDSPSYVAPGRGGDGTFRDDDGSVFEADIERLSAAGITKGCNPPVDDRFCPDDAVTRGEMAAFLVRAVGL